MTKDTKFKSGEAWTGNANGRPKGSISVIGRLKKAFEEDPEGFEAFIKRYKENPANEKHITEMIDGKPMASIDLTSKGESLKPLTKEEQEKLDELINA